MFFFLTLPAVYRFLDFPASLRLRLGDYVWETIAWCFWWLFLMTLVRYTKLSSFMLPHSLACIAFLFQILLLILSIQDMICTWSMDASDITFEFIIWQPIIISPRQSTPRSCLSDAFTSSYVSSHLSTLQSTPIVHGLVMLLSG